MKKNIFLLVLFEFSFLANLFSQTWITKIDTTHNFYDVQQKFNEYWDPIIKQEEEEKNGIFNKLFGRTKDENERPGWEVFKRWEWFMEPRVYPSGDMSLPSTNYQNFIEYIQNNPQLNISPGVPGITIGGGSSGGGHPSANGGWTSLGPNTVPSPVAGGGGAGRVNCIRFNPLNSNSIWIGTPGGGLWHTVDGGSNWTTNTDALTMLGVSDVLIDPTDTTKMYLGTGDGDHSDTYSIGILKSTDAGVTWNNTGAVWTPVNTTFRVVSKMIMDPTNSSIILVATNNGIYRTTNGGTSWSTQTTPASGNFKDIEFKPDNHNVVYAAAYSSGKFYRSTDNGVNFTNITSGLPAAGTDNRYAIGVTAANANYVYVLGSLNSNSGFGGVYLSTDSGTTFATKSTTPNCLGWDTGSDTGGQGWYTLSIAVSPTNADTLIIGGVNIWKSGNKGVNWTQVSHWYGGFSKPYVHADIHALEFLPGNSGTFFAGCDGGVFKTTNSGGAWTDKSNTLVIAQQYKLSTSATNSNLNITGHQDNGTNKRSSGTWTQIYGGDGMECIIDPTNANTMFATIYYGAIDISTNGGTSFPWPTIASSGGAAGTVNENGNWVTPYVLNPLKTTTMLVGKTKVYRSYNIGTSGVTFSAVGSITSAGSGNVVAIAYAPSDTNYIYVAKSNALFVSTNGTTFTDKTGTLPVGSASITYIAVSSTDKLKAWVTFSGYSSANKVCATSDGGTTWTNISTGLPNLPVNCIVYESGATSTDPIYVGTDVGIYYRNYSSVTSWQSFFSGLPNVIVDELEIQYSTSKLRAATFGRGLWESDLRTFLNAGFTASPLTVCVGTTVTYTDTTSGTVTSWAWNFGANATPATANTAGPHTVTYSATGLKTAQLIVIGPEGSDTATYTNYITVASTGAAGGAGTFTWTGAVSIDWFDACNWSTLKTPNGLSDVVIPSGTTFSPKITGVAASCNTLTIASSTGAVLTIDSGGGGSLSITQ